MKDHAINLPHLLDDDTIDAVVSGANDVKDKASDALDGATEGVERAARSVSSSVALASDKAAAALGSTAEYVRELDSRHIVDDLMSMAKRHPGITMAAAVAVGFLVGRSARRS